MVQMSARCQGQIHYNHELLTHYSELILVEIGATLQSDCTTYKEPGLTGIEGSKNE